MAAALVLSFPPPFLPSFTAAPLPSFPPPPLPSFPRKRESGGGLPGMRRQGFYSRRTAPVSRSRVRSSPSRARLTSAAVKVRSGDWK